MKLIVADFNQIELRILAHQTKDPNLVYAFQHGLDLHTQTASLIWKIPPDQVTPEQRAIAKNSNFNFAFGGGPSRVVEMSGISIREAQEVYDAWHHAYRGVRRWGSQVERLCWEQGYVESLYGRKRRLKDIYSPDIRLQRYAERQAVNHGVQGTAADIAKIALVQVYEVLHDFDAWLTLQIHDEFVIECVADQVDDVIPLIKVAMEDIKGLDGRPVLDVPLEVNIGVGSNWAACK
jgi:DNA polymerase-1